MYKSEQARQVIYHQDPSIDTDWLDTITIYTDRMEISKADNEQLTKGFMRGLLAGRVIGIGIGIELLYDLGL